jgi:cytochrome P450
MAIQPTEAEIVNADSEQSVAGGGCPVADWPMYGAPRAPLTYFKQMDELRNRGDVFQMKQNTRAHLYTKYEQIVEIAQHAEFFSNAVIDPATNAPGGFELIPQSLDGQKHTDWRKILGRYFAPGRVKQLTPMIRDHAISLIDAFVAK